MHSQQPQKSVAAMAKATRTPAEHFQLIVAPNYRRFLRDPGSEVDAVNAVYATAHLVDWAYWYWIEHDPAQLGGAQDEKGFRAALFAQCSQLQIVHDLADASKHRFLTRSARTRLVTSATAAFAQTDTGFVIQPLGMDLGDILERAVKYWTDRLGLA